MHGCWVGALSPCCHCPLEVGGNLSATRRCGSTTSANPSDGRSGHRAPHASRQHHGNQHGKTKEERRVGGSTPERQARRPSRGSWNVTPAAWKNSLPVPLQSTTGRFCKVGKGCASALLKGVVHGPAHRTSLGLFDLSGPLTSLGLSGLFRL